MITQDDFIARVGDDDDPAKVLYCYPKVMLQPRPPQSMSKPEP